MAVTPPSVLIADRLTDCHPGHRSAKGAETLAVAGGGGHFGAPKRTITWLTYTIVASAKSSTITCFKNCLLR